MKKETSLLTRIANLPIVAFTQRQPGDGTGTSPVDYNHKEANGG